MKFHSSVIFVKDINKAKEFYIDFLGMEIEHDFGRNIILKTGLSLWELWPEHVIPLNLKSDKDTHNFELYFDEDDLDELAEKLHQRQVKLLHPIHEEPWGQRTIRFFDSDGHLLEAGEPLEVFIRNMHKNGMSIEQISKKSGVSIKVVSALIA